jgi:hypothetical protein
MKKTESRKSRYTAPLMVILFRETYIFTIYLFTYLVHYSSPSVVDKTFCKFRNPQLATHCNAQIC